MTTRKTVFLALLIAQSLALFLFEGLIPLPFLAPGAKLGLANLVTVIALYTLAARDAAAVIVVRIVLASFFGGGPTVLLYSLAGGLLSLGAMLLLKRAALFSIVGVSLAGGFCHNLAQLAIAIAVMGTPALIYYLPILGTCGIVTGTLIGLVAGEIVRHLQRTITT